MSKITREAVLAALSKVQEPELHQDLVSLGMVRDLNIEGDVVSFSVMLTTPACPLRGKIEKEAREAVEALGTHRASRTKPRGRHHRASADHLQGHSQHR